MTRSAEKKAYEEAEKEFTIDFRSWGNEELLSHATKTLTRIQEITRSLLSNTEYVNKLHYSSRRAAQELERRAKNRTEKLTEAALEEAKVEAARSSKRSTPEKPVSPKGTVTPEGPAKKTKKEETKALVDKKFDKPEKSTPSKGVGKSAAVDQAIIDASVRVEQQRRLDHAARVHRENLTRKGERLEEIEGNSKKTIEKKVLDLPETEIPDADDDLPLATILRDQATEPLPKITAESAASTEESIRKQQRIEHEKALRKQALQLQYELMEAKLKELNEQLKTDSEQFSALE